MCTFKCSSLPLPTGGDSSLSNLRFLTMTLKDVCVWIDLTVIATVKFNGNQVKAFPYQKTHKRTHHTHTQTHHTHTHTHSHTHHTYTGFPLTEDTQTHTPHTHTQTTHRQREIHFPN